MKRIIFVVTTLFLIVTLFSCTGYKMYRSDLAECSSGPETDCEQHAVSHHPGIDDYYLGFVEFDDQGQLKSREQMQTVLDTFYTIAGQDDIILKVFVHGWQHSAAQKDKNVESFKKLLLKIAQNESRSALQDNRQKRQVVGVFVGWRGKSLSVPGLNLLTFWDRKATAQEVGLQGLTELLVKLEEIINVKTGIDENEGRKPQSRMVVMGHSFGGAALYTSVQQILSGRFINSWRGKTSSEDAAGFADLVVLLNPAFEALRFSTLYDISQQNCRSFGASQMPRLAILTSEKDRATKIAFPAGRLLPTFLSEHHRKMQRNYCSADGVQPMIIDQYQADIQTVGHFKPYWTHHLDPHQEARPKNFVLRTMLDEWGNQQYGTTLEFARVELTHLGRTDPQNPYMNIRVNGDIMANHGDIWGDQVMSFIEDLVIISTAPKP